MGGLNKMVSVIIPVFNGTYIKETLLSVKKQTYTNMEVIVIDDGSTDNTPELIRSFSGLCVIRTANRGVASARNTGVRAAKGEFISFLDADDIWVKEKTGRQVDLFRVNKGIDLVYSRFRNYFQPGCEPPPGINKEKFLHPDTGKMMSLCSLLLKRETFHSVGYFDESLRTGEDLDWFVRLKEKGVPTLFDDFPVTERRLHDSNISYQSSNKVSGLARILKASMERKRRSISE